jgi:diadenosine tetraphosphate (Ap4A) HIT family hydrolase
VHVLGRKVGDVVWPRPVWGATNPVKYEAAAAEAAMRKIMEALNIEIVSRVCTHP